jgi:excisionase family DNA binding protein
MKERKHNRLKLKPNLYPELQRQQEQQRQQGKVGKDESIQGVPVPETSIPAALADNRVHPTRKPDQGGGVAPETVSPLPAKVKPIPQLRLSERLTLRPKEAAAALGISERTLREWMRNEDLPYLKVDRSILIPIPELNEWMKERLKTQENTDALADEILNDF